MKPHEQGKLTPRDQEAVQNVLNGIGALFDFLQENSVPVDPSPEDFYKYLAKMKQIQRNASNGASLVACVLAKKYLDAQLTMRSFNASDKDQSAKGLDIDETTVANERVIGEVKTTVPCGAKDLFGNRDLGAQQKVTFEKDFQKLNALPIAKHRFFFVTDPATFNLMRDKYAQKIPGVKVVLLPNGDETFTA